MKIMKSRLGRMETELASWGAKLDELSAKVVEAGADVKAERSAHLKELKAKHAVARTKLDELKAAGSGEWDTIKVGVDGAWQDLEVAFKKLTN